MPTPTTNALIPVGVGELMYVSLRHVLDYVEANDACPPALSANMRKALRRYEKDRTEALIQRGFSATAILRYTQNAHAKLQEWLAEKSAKTSEAQEDFSKWKEELGK